MILLIDNYDSFTFNLLHFLGEVGAECVMRHNDAVSVEAILANFLAIARGSNVQPRAA